MASVSALGLPSQTTLTANSAFNNSSQSLDELSSSTHQNFAAAAAAPPPLVSAVSVVPSPNYHEQNANYSYRPATPPLGSSSSSSSSAAASVSFCGMGADFTAMDNPSAYDNSNSAAGYAPSGYLPSEYPPHHQQPTALTGVSANLSNPASQASAVDHDYPTAVPSWRTAHDSRPKVTTTLWEDEGTLCFQVEANSICVARREDNDMINGTKLLNVAGMTRGRRDGILKTEKRRHVVKVGAMHLKGVWIPFDRALAFARKEKIVDLLYPLFVEDIKSTLYDPLQVKADMGSSQSLSGPEAPSVNSNSMDSSTVAISNDQTYGYRTAPPRNSTDQNAIDSADNNVSNSGNSNMRMITHPMNRASVDVSNTSSPYSVNNSASTPNASNGTNIGTNAGSNSQYMVNPYEMNYMSTPTGYPVGNGVGMNQNMYQTPPQQRPSQSQPPSQPQQHQPANQNQSQHDIGHQQMSAYNAYAMSQSQANHQGLMPHSNIPTNYDYMTPTSQYSRQSSISGYPISTSTSLPTPPPMYTYSQQAAFAMQPQSPVLGMSTSSVPSASNSTPGNVPMPYQQQLQQQQQQQQQQQGKKEISLLLILKLTLLPRSRLIRL